MKKTHPITIDVLADVCVIHGHPDRIEEMLSVVKAMSVAGYRASISLPPGYALVIPKGTETPPVTERPLFTPEQEAWIGQALLHAHLVRARPQAAA